MDGRFLYYCGVGAGFFSRNDEAKSRGAKVHRSKTDGYETGTGNGIRTVPYRLVFGRHGALLHLSGHKPLSLPAAYSFHKIDHIKCLIIPFGGVWPSPHFFWPCRRIAVHSLLQMVSCPYYQMPQSPQITHNLYEQLAFTNSSCS